MYRTILIATLVLASLAGGDAYAAAGRLQFVVGEVSVEGRDGQVRSARKGDEVEEGETLVTGADGQAQVLMLDDGILALRPATRLRIDTFRYAGTADGNEKSVLALLRGGLRAITGVIGRINRKTYTVVTPKATIGIRGTDHEAVYIPPPEAGETPLDEPGTYDKVNVGATYIENEAGSIEVAANQVGFAGVLPGVAPVLLPQMPGFLRGAAALRGERGRAQSGERGGDARRNVVRTGLANAAVARVVAPPVAGTVDAANPAPGFVVAPKGYAATGGDVSGSVVGSGGGVVGNDFAVLLDAQRRPNNVASSEFAYARSGAPVVQSESRSIADGSEVVWGIYGGGAINDRNGARRPSFFHFMGAPGATANAVLVPALVQPLTFTALPGNREYTLPIAENGVVGGSVALSITLRNVSGVPSVDAYRLGVVDGNGRTWTAGLANGPVELSKFLSGAGENLGVSCPACAQPNGSGHAHGIVVGSTAPRGVLSSYDLKAGSAGVTGSVLAR